MKPVNIAVSLAAIIALIGDLFFMGAVLLTAGEAAGVIAAESAGNAEIAQLGQTFGLIIAVGWLWAIAVLITCLFALKRSLLDSRNRK